jgi:hypothetical protein
VYARRDLASANFRVPAAIERQRGSS